ncbi:MAG: hypothetical protein OEL54_06065 [Flavobacteriaceae bacterium]|nr:hypothetical protein [Flavobacteriaceae bacterium]
MEICFGCNGKLEWFENGIVKCTECGNEYEDTNDYGPNIMDYGKYL